MADIHDKERALFAEVAPQVERGVPGVEVLALELSGPERSASTSTIRPASTTRCASGSRTSCAPTCDRVHGRRLLARQRAARSASRRTSPSAVGHKVALRTAEEIAGRKRSAARWSPPATRRSPSSTGDEAVEIPYDAIVRGNLIDEEVTSMSREIIEAVRELEREKNIESGALVSALEDALLAAYKKTPGASRHATVELDDEGDFRVFAIEHAGRTSRSGCSTRRVSARSTSSSASRRRRASASTRCSPTTTSRSTGTRFPRSRSSARTSRPRTSAASPRRPRSRSSSSASARRSAR